MKPSSPAARPACSGSGARYAGLRLIEAGPTGRATMPQVELSVSFVLRATWSDTRDTLLRGRRHRQTTVRAPPPPRGREALSAHPPALLTTRPTGASNNRPENTLPTATLSP